MKGSLSFRSPVGGTGEIHAKTRWSATSRPALGEGVGKGWGEGGVVNSAARGAGRGAERDEAGQSIRYHLEWVA